MNDDQLDHLLDEARTTFRVPPEPKLDAMWRQIDARRGSRQPQPARATRWWPALGVAAALVLAFSLGRFTATRSDGAAAGAAIARASTSPAATPATPVGSVTSELLGQTAVLLAAIPAGRDNPNDDRRFAQQAGELLATTRLLLDSRTADGDPRLRALLEDLELMLAQVARMRPGEPPTERELINEALQQQDLVPRIRTIAAGLSAGAD